MKNGRTGWRDSVGKVPWERLILRQLDEARCARRLVLTENEIRKYPVTFAPVNRALVASKVQKAINQHRLAKITIIGSAIYLNFNQLIVCALSKNKHKRSTAASISPRWQSCTPECIYLIGGPIVQTIVPPLER